jgi:acyl-CoA thioesterase
MPPEDPEEWFNGNVYASFVELMKLAKLDDSTFRSGFPAYSPGNSTRAYGGHVFAQAALAASRTLKPGFVIHVCECFSFYSATLPTSRLLKAVQELGVEDWKVRGFS